MFHEHPIGGDHPARPLRSGMAMHKHRLPPRIRLANGRQGLGVHLRIPEAVAIEGIVLSFDAQFGGDLLLREQGFPTLFFIGEIDDQADPVSR
jgi:hypothetical protein